MLEYLSQFAKNHPTPCFVYFMDEVAKRIDGVKRAFGGAFEVSYAMKCNPNPAVLEWMSTRVATLDVSSGGELSIAMRNGWPAERISFTGPAKRAPELQLAVDAGVGEVIVESVREAIDLDAMAAAAGKRQRILVRVAPAKVPRGFGVAMAGKPCQFGIDEEVLDEALTEILALRNLKLIGFHIYSGTQCLKPPAIVENYEIFLDIFEAACEQHDITPERLIFGAGIGVPYHDGDETVDIDAVAKGIAPRLAAFRSEPRFAGATMLLETGRYLIGEAGYYLTSIVNRKESRGAHICVCDGGMNHHLGATGHLGMVLHRPYKLYKIASSRPDGPEEAFNLFGPLCTTIDHLGHGVKFPGLDAGDVLAVGCSGAYGATASPINFISHNLPIEYMIETVNGEVVERRIDNDYARERI